MFKETNVTSFRLKRFSAILAAVLLLLYMLIPAINVEAAELKDVATAKWENATTVSIQITSETAVYAVEGYDIRIKKVAEGMYTYVGDGFDKEADGKSVFRGGPRGTEFECENSGVTHSRDGQNNLRYNYLDGSTTRLLVSGAGAQTGTLISMFKVGDACVSHTTEIDIEQSTTGGSNVIGEWVDAGTIKIVVDSGGIYRLAAGSQTDFFAENQGECKDAVRIRQPDENGKTPATFYNQKEGEGSPINGSCGLEREWGGFLDKVAENKNKPAGTGDTGVTDGDAPESNCESKTKISMGWLLCAVLELADNVLLGGSDGGGLLGVVDSLLNVDSSSYDNDQIRETWGYFRNLATFLLILVGLTMIIGQAISKD
jgi:hypothetical protein